MTAIVRDDGGVRLTTPAESVRARRVVRHERLPAVRARDPALRRAAVRPRARDAAAVGRAVGRPRVAAKAGPRRHGEPVHYHRRTEDGRILWGGYDAVCHWRNGVDPAFEDREATFDALLTHFFETFPQLDGIRFSHRWAGVRRRARVRRGLQGLGRGCHAVRRARGARPRGRARYALNPPGARAEEADPVPAGTAAKRRYRPHAAGVHTRGPPRRSSGPVAAAPRRRRAQLRLLTGPVGIPKCRERRHPSRARCQRRSSGSRTRSRTRRARSGTGRGSQACAAAA